jgi:hypothetical protein
VRILDEETTRFQVPLTFRQLELSVKADFCPKEDSESERLFRTNAPRSSITPGFVRHKIGSRVAVYIGLEISATTGAR